MNLDRRVLPLDEVGVAVEFVLLTVSLSLLFTAVVTAQEFDEPGTKLPSMNVGRFERASLIGECEGGCYGRVCKVRRTPRSGNVTPCLLAFPGNAGRQAGRGLRQADRARQAGRAGRGVRGDIVSDQLTSRMFEWHHCLCGERSAEKLRLSYGESCTRSSHESRIKVKAL